MKPIKIAAISGIIIVIVCVMYPFIGAFNLPLPVLMTMQILTIGCSALFVYGFVAIGKKYKNSLLKITAIYLLIFTIVSSIAFMYGLYYANIELTKFIQESNLEKRFQELNNTYGGEKNIPEDVLERELQSEIETLQGILPKVLKILIGIWIGYFIFYGIPKIIFGIALMRSEKDVKFAKVTGVLNIISGATTIILVGYVLFLVAFIFELILLFKEAEKEDATSTSTKKKTPARQKNSRE